MVRLREKGEILTGFAVTQPKMKQLHFSELERNKYWDGREKRCKKLEGVKRQWEPVRRHRTKALEVKWSFARRSRGWVKRMERGSLLERLALILKLSAILLDWPKSLFGVFSISLFPDIMIFPCIKLPWLVYVLKIRSVWFISCAKLKNPKWTFGQLDILLAFLPFPPNHRWSFSGNWERSLIPYMGWCGVECRVYLRC